VKSKKTAAKRRAWVRRMQRKRRRRRKTAEMRLRGGKGIREYVTHLLHLKTTTTASVVFLHAEKRHMLFG